MSSTRAPQLEIKSGKVLSHAQARGGFSTALIYEPDLESEQAHGSLMFVVDISSPSPLSADIAYNLIDIIKEEYYSDLELSPSQSFENALKAANEELVAIAKQGEKDWIGKFNAIIAAVSKGNLYIVQRGTAEIHLLRGTHMVNLSKGMYVPGESYRPEETLVNLIEGQVQVGDKLVMSTSELFYYISIEKLRRLIDGGTPAQAAKKLADQLASENEINRTSVLIAECTLPEIGAQESSESEPTENWVGVPPEAKPKQRPVVNVFSPAEPVIDKTQTVEEILEPETSWTAPVSSAAGMSASEADDVIVEEDTPASALRSMLSQVPRPSFEGLRDRVNLDGYRDKINLGGYASKLKLNSPAISQGLTTAWRIIRGIALMLWAGIAGLAGLVINLFKNLRKRKNGNVLALALGGALVLVLIFSSLAISRAYSQNVSTKKAEAALISAEQKKNEAQTSMIYENSAKARGLFAEAFVLAQTAADNPNTKEKADALLADLQKQLDGVSGVKRLANVQPLINFDVLSPQLASGDTNRTAELSKIAVVGGDIYGIDPTHNKIYKYKTVSGEPSIANSLSSTDKNLRLVTQVTATDLAIFATPPNMYKFNTATNTMAGVGLDNGNWNSGDQILGYTDKIYMLDGGNNQIYKYQEVPEGYTPIASYFEGNSDINLKGALGMAIDGNVWVLLPDNTVKKFLGGADTNLNLRQVPDPYPAFGTLTHLYTANGIDVYLIDADNDRVLRYNKEGEYLGQYIYDNIENPTDLYVDQAGGFIYIAAGTSVYRLPLQ